MPLSGRNPFHWTNKETTIIYYNSRYCTNLQSIMSAQTDKLVIAGVPQTPADCQRIYAGDDTAIRAYIERLDQ